MRFSVVTRCRGLVLSTAMLVLSVGCIAGLPRASFADGEAKPDPSGIATGDRTSVADAGGNAFVVTEPTDKSAADYTQKATDLQRLSGDGRQGAAGGEVGRRRRARAHRHEHVVDLEHRLPRALHASGVRAAHLRPGAQEERGASDDAELRGLRLRLPRLLRRRLRVSVGRRGHQRCARCDRWHADAQRVPHRRRSVGIPRRQRFLPERSGVRRQLEHVDAVRSRLHGDGRLHHRRRHLRAHHVLGLHPVRAVRRRHSLSDLRLLGVGRRLDVAARLDDGSGPRLRRLCRFDRRPCRRRLLRHGTGRGSRSAPWQVRERREAARLPGAQHRLRRDGNIHPALRVDGLQSRVRPSPQPICASRGSR